MRVARLPLASRLTAALGAYASDEARRDRFAGAWNFCPLCCGEIKRVLMKDGTETEKYWTWVEEVKPKLPKDFALKFEIHGGLIREEVAERKTGSDGAKRPPRSATCAIS